MNKVDGLPITKEINIDKNHIDNFKLETETGTKRVKEKFHKEAVNNRNNYVNRQLNIFSNYKVQLENEMVKRVKDLMPKDKSLEYEEYKKRVNSLLELVKLNCNITDNFKLKLDFIVATINEDTSLDELNFSIKKFIDKFREFNITLTCKDFKYTMFTEMYMKDYFKNYKFNSNMNDTFESIYFKCPDIKLQLKMNLINIVSKYEKDINKFLTSYVEKKMTDSGISSDNIINEYILLRNNVGKKIAKDEYYNTMIFLDDKRKINDYLVGSPTRVKNYNTFTDDYDKLDEYSKNNYNSSVMSLYLTLNELKKYYKYEFIVDDLLKRYKDRESAKSSFLVKKKEIEKEEKVRESIYKEYLKACGIGFLARKNEVKMKNAMLKMNEQVTKLKSLYDEYNDLEITNNLNDLNESATIYDVFMVSLTSFSFISKCFIKNDDFSNKSLEENIDDYFRFIFNPNNLFLRKTNCLVEFDITNIICLKYKLLEINITDELINKDNIDSTLDTLSFINIIQNIESSNITLDTISNIYNMKKIVSINRDNLEVI